MAHAAPVVDADAHVHRLFASYAGMPVGVVTQCAANHTSLLHDSWQPAKDRTWSENARALFEHCDDYVFELLHHATTRSQHRAAYCSEHLWPWFLAAGPQVLDFGGGLGLASSLLADAGKQVTYCDVAGPAARFARWFFGQLGQSIEMLQTSATRTELPAGRQWDLVLAEHVLEHVADPVATVEMLARTVRSGGLLHLVLGSPGPEAGPLVRAVEAEQLLAGSPALRAMSRLPSGDPNHSLFRGS